MEENKIKEESGKWESFINYGKVSVTLGGVLGVTIAIPITIATWSIWTGLKGLLITFVVGCVVGAFLSIMFAVKDGRETDNREV
jgi:uncharacterized membrane protein YkgB